MDVLFAKRTKTRGAQTKFGQMGIFFEKSVTKIKKSPKRKLFKGLHVSIGICVNGF